MKYISAEVIFPEELLKEIQKYVQGNLVYIPNAEGTRRGWGECSGSRMYLYQRNQTIRMKFREGCSVDQLSGQYCLSIDSIKKIVYTSK